jgi:PAS domain-containing protein
MREKLVGIIVLTTGLTLAIGFGLLVTIDVRHFRRALLENSIAIARITGSNLIGELTFLDRDSARETLNNLGTIEAINDAWLYDEGNKLLASFFRREGAPLLKMEMENRNHFSGEFLHVYQPVMFRGQKFGTLYLRVSVLALREKIRNYLMIMIGVVAGLIGLTFLLAIKLQGVISKPVIELADIVSRVTAAGDFSRPVQMHRTDEIGTLIRAFDNMLEQIHKRDIERDLVEQELQEARLFLSNVIESMPSILIALDERGTIIQWNRAASQTTSIPAEEALGQNLWQLLPVLAHFRSPAEELIRNPKPLVFFREV